MNTPPNKTTLETLAFIKYLFGQAQGEAQKPEPFCTVGLLTLHDAVELFLVLAREQPGVDMSQVKPASPNFMDYWNMILPDGTQLGQKASMHKLNKMRVDLKHFGVILPRKEIISLGTLVEEFFEQNTPSAFGLPFGQISLLFLVSHTRAKTHLETAEAANEGGDVETALAELAIAFEILMDYYNDLSNVPLKHERHTWPARFQYRSDKLDAVGDQIDDLNRQVKDIETAVSLLALEVRYASYLIFKSHTPHVASYLARDLEDGRGYQVFKRTDYVPSKEKYQTCLNFVVEVAVSIERLFAWQMEV